MAAFVGSIILCPVEKPFGPAIVWRLKSHRGPKQASLNWDILFSMLISNPHHAAKKENGHLSVWMPAVPTGLPSLA